ncbi:UNVERIFIED_CONTAM: putative clathrin assembly protein [Sesamum calycinum]|uniref:Clathrin assembly protein n=1 Tax=Sesamum calycinum TaxID=2727403 RepID=A0AAW2QY24_9LAMI
MGTLQTWRKAYGALKDHTKVGLAHVNSDFKDVDVAIVKATNHVECPPKERHLRKILVATSAMRPRADVAYCIHALARRLAKTHNWTVALKTLIVIHRALREGDPTFREELLNFQQRGASSKCRISRTILALLCRVIFLHYGVKSKTNKQWSELDNAFYSLSPAWDCSAWVRTYALFLEERLECFRILKYDIEAERLPRPAQGQDKGYSRTRDLDSEELLDQLPALQQLLYRLIGCRPEGAAVGNYVIQYALALKTSPDFAFQFFEMPRHEAIKALDIYKRAGQQANSLSDFYEVCKGLELARNFQFPVLREPPQSFLVTMERVYKRSTKDGFCSKCGLEYDTFRIYQEYPERLMLTYKEEDVPPPSEETKIVSEEEPGPPQSDEVAISTAETAPPPPPPPTNLDTDDLLGLNVTTQDASAIEETNALALAIVPSGTTPFDSDASQVKDFDPTGWELALVTTPSTNLSSVQERQLAGGLDSLTLNSLYDEGAYRASQQPVYGAPAPNPFEVSDPFAISSNVPPPPTIQMAAMAQPQNNPFAPFQPAYPPPQQQQQHLLMSPQNPFGDAGFGAFPAAPAAHPQTTNPFGSSSLL